MEKQELLNIVKKRIEYLKANINLTKKFILNAQSNRDFESAIRNIKSYDNENYALFELKKLEEDLK